MDGTDSNHSNKRTKNECGSGFRIDRISELPDEIIHIILSFLPSREAASTSVLSHRWPHLWKHSSNLDFLDTKTKHNSRAAEMSHHLKMVNSVLKSHQALFLKQFRISFYVNKSARSRVTKWLEFAQLRQVEMLDLNFHCMSEKRAVLLEDLVRPMKYLKTLCLAGMKVSGEDISYFLKNCPLLRELNMTTLLFTSDLHVSGNLEILRITGCTIRKSVINISAPHLYEAAVEAKPGHLRFKDVPRLAIASLGIGSLRYNVANFSSTLSCFTSHLQKLTLFLLYPKILLKEGFPYMLNLKELYVVVRGKYAHHCLVPVTSIMSTCPRLQKFTFEFFIKDKDATPDDERCPHQRLRILKFQGSCATDIIKWMTYISNCCDAYQKINRCSPNMSKTKIQAHMDHMQQLQAHLSQQVEFEFT